MLGAGSRTLPNRSGSLPVSALLGLTGLALLLRLAMFARSLSAIDKLFIPDDAYYTLSIARSLAHGLGPTADGVTATSGFQPLLAFLMTPFYALGVGDDAALRIDLLLLLIADAAVVWIIGIIGYRLAGRAAALTAAAVWAVSPVAIALSLGGLESSLAVLCAAALVAAWMWAGDRPSEPTRRVVVGVLAGLAILARVDLLLLVGLLLVAELGWGSLRGAITTAGSAVVVIAPWWLWCTYEFGSPIPGSGAAAHRIAPVGAFSTASQAVVGATVAAGPFGRWDGLRQLLYTHEFWGALCFWVITLVFAAGAVLAASRFGPTFKRIPRGSRAESSVRSLPRGAYVAVLCALAAGLMVFYAWFAVVWYVSRYVLPVAFVITVLLGIVAARCSTRVANLRLVAAVLAIAVAAALVGDYQLATAQTAQQRLFIAATGYRGAARRALALVPDGARLGAWQSGALSYYGRRRITIVNIDGVVNPKAPDPNDWRAVGRYLERRDVRWLADWQVKIVGFAYNGIGAMRPTRELTEIATFRQGTRASLVLVRIDVAGRRVT